MAEFKYEDFTDLIWQNHFRTHEVDEDVIEMYACQFNDLTWEIICEFQKLSGKFIKLFKYDIPIRHLLKHQKVHQNIIEEEIQFFQDHMYHICRYQYLSEDFILRHHKIMNWANVFRYQNHLSIIFIKRNFSRYFGRDISLDATRYHQYFSNAVSLRWNKRLAQIVRNHNKKLSIIRQAKHSSYLNNNM